MAKINRSKLAGPAPGAALHPLGRMFVRVAARRPARARLLAALVFAGCAALLSVAASLTPAAAGLGTHQQLHLPPCLLVVLFGVPCPTCGLTTAFAHTVRGELWSAFHAQPAGFALALGTIFAAGFSLGVMLTGKVWRVNWYRVRPERIIPGVLLLMLVGWIYKLTVGWISGSFPFGG